MDLSSYRPILFRRCLVCPEYSPVETTCNPPCGAGTVCALKLHACWECGGTSCVPLVLSPVNTSTTLNSLDANSSTTHPGPAGGEIGVVVGASFVVVIAVLLVVYLIWRSKKKQREEFNKERIRNLQHAGLRGAGGFGNVGPPSIWTGTTVYEPSKMNERGY